MIVYAAFYGEYEEAYPIGIYDTLEKAKKAVEDSHPTYTTEIKSYDLSNGQVVDTWLYQYEWDVKLNTFKENRQWDK